MRKANDRRAKFTMTAEDFQRVKECAGQGRAGLCSKVKRFGDIMSLTPTTLSDLYRGTRWRWRELTFLVR